MRYKSSKVPFFHDIATKYEAPHGPDEEGGQREGEAQQSADQRGGDAHRTGDEPVLTCLGGHNLSPAMRKRDARPAPCASP